MKPEYSGIVFYFFVFSFLFAPSLAFQHFGERKNLTLLLVSIVPAFVGYVWILVGTRSFPKRFLKSSLVLKGANAFQRIQKFSSVFNQFNILNIPFRFWIGFGLLIRVILLFSDPILSEDVYRFLWDGLLLTQGLSPFSFLPKEFSWMDAPLELRPIYFELLIDMNSLKFYSVYPPILQFLFWISATGMLFWKNVKIGILIWKCFLLLSEFGVLLFLLSIFKKRNIPFVYSLIYWMNPLVLLEIGGNAHPESILLFFLIGTVEFAVRWMESDRVADFLTLGFFFLCGILTKITPLILVPFFLFVFWKRKKFFVLVSCSAGIALGAFGLFFGGEGILKQESDGLGVFFQLFEFNGSAYYVLREFLRAIGENFYAAGKLCGAITLVAISIFSFQKRDTTGLKASFTTIETIYLIFLLFSTTVHPWYILPLLLASIFSGNVYPIVWSFLIFVSYSTYSSVPYRDSPVWLCFEYGVLFLFLHIDYKSRSLQNE
ncbi:dolichyl-phosphate-mannose--protein mannosyltransferase [Leptospira barantonii]|uniref:Dolichyl-phosphate-mannose--protein mannosyltransferase n=1 Tax=Leptospira barantonii TaxID=2023184 RepID=A0ABX4NIX2_9LEPT|nr:dolichyl-phosphate-mannose--protein mannosyltransferase [Leptospira barantonii]